MKRTFPIYGIYGIARAIAIEGAKRYAAGDKSDPFAFNRAMTHINNGIVNHDPEHGLILIGYDAEPYQEQRELPTGEKYHVTCYKNRRRP